MVLPSNFYVWINIKLKGKLLIVGGILVHSHKKNQTFVYHAGRIVDNFNIANKNKMKRSISIREKKNNHTSL